MGQIDILRQAYELWQTRRTVCDLNLELIRRDLAALEVAAARATTDEPAATDAAQQG